MARYLIVLLTCFCAHAAQAQVESYGRSQDEVVSDSINPEDTVTIPPKFENGDNDFLRYLENHFNTTLYRNQLKPLGDMVQFEIAITKSGEVDEFRIISSSNFALNDPLQDVLYSMPKWTPGKVGGKTKKIRLIYALKIRSSDTPPYIQIDKESMSSQYDPSTKNIKAFLIAGALLIFGTLVLVR